MFLRARLYVVAKLFCLLWTLPLALAEGCADQTQAKPRPNDPSSMDPAGTHEASVDSDQEAGTAVSTLDAGENGTPDASTGAVPHTVDPGNKPWQPVPRGSVAKECGLDPDLLDAADTQLNRRWGIVRYGKLCHDFYPGSDSAETPYHVFSSSKTFGATVVGRVMYETRKLVKTGPRTGPIDELQRVDQWFDKTGTNYDIHQDAKIAHVLAMVAYSDDLSFGQKVHSYDADGTREINALSNILNAALQQDKARLGADLEEFTQRFVYAPLGLEHSTWTDGAKDKQFAISWNTTIRDMLRVGLLINNGGVWNGERLIAADYLYRTIHPTFEEGNTGYGYLTWLNGADHRPPLVGTLIKIPTPSDTCAPLALHRAYPHGISEAKDCGYTSAPYTCKQQFDIGAWSAQGLGGNYIYGHRGLDLVIAIQDYGTINLVDSLWKIVRPALVALDPKYKGDDADFCKAYGSNAYAPDLKLWAAGL